MFIAYFVYYCLYKNLELKYDTHIRNTTTYIENPINLTSMISFSSVLMYYNLFCFFFTTARLRILLTFFVFTNPFFPIFPTSRSRRLQEAHTKYVSAIFRLAVFPIGNPVFPLKRNDCGPLIEDVVRYRGVDVFLDFYVAVFKVMWPFS